MKEVLILGFFFFLIGWILQICGLYFAVKYKEINKATLSKLGYISLVLGEVITKATLISLVVIFVNRLFFN